MNKFLLAILTVLTIASFAQSDPVIMSVDGEEVSRSEFEQIFWKNKKEDVTNQAELDEYVKLFTKFKLKVRAAEAEGIDTTKKFLSEFNGYKFQLQKPYLVDTAINEELIQEAYYRTVNELKASHLLLLCGADQSPEDTLKVYNRIVSIQKDIAKGKLTFDEAAVKYSQDESVKVNKGNLGYFSAFRMVYPFEDAAYRTDMGKVSNPVRTQFGYHLINPTETRKSRGKVKVAHIMVRVQKNATDVERENALKKINEISAKIKEGENFGALVRDFSDDRNSVRRNGELDWVEPGKYYPEFEAAAFELKEDDAVSEPILTPAGYHILKRTQFKPVGNLADLRVELKNKIQRDSQRSLKTKTSFLNKLKASYGFVAFTQNFETYKNTVSNKIKEVRWKAEEVKNLKGELFAFDGQSYTQADFTAYLVASNTYDQSLTKVEFLNRELDRFISSTLTDYERSRLEEKYPAYKHLLKEYRDGLLLFEINDQKVWSYSVKDTAGLQEFYEANKQNFMWEDRVKARIFTSTDKKVIKKAYKLVKKGDIQSDSIVNYLNADSQLNCDLESGLFETESHEILSKTTYKKGLNKPVLVDNKYVLIAIDEQLPSRPKKLNEAKGAYTAAYQEYLEKMWLEELAAKYAVEVDNEVLYSIKTKPGK
ncbi:MAG: peptidyl-prolyl cis-trans isomerase SurA [Flavobacteriales bacterium]|jgi:peptidyl-prolyl cis-trans isomerase SurA